MGFETLLTAIGFLVIALWAYVVFMLLKIGGEIYGGKYTEVLPPTLAAFTMFLVIGIIEHPFTMFLQNGGGTPMELVFSLHTLQVLGGIFLIIAMERIYKIGFATSGFTAKEGDWDDE